MAIHPAVQITLKMLQLETKKNQLMSFVALQYWLFINWLHDFFFF